MAKRSARIKGKRGRKRSKSSKSGSKARGTTKIKGHWRSPRGNNKGKPRVWVPAHRRGTPR